MSPSIRDQVDLDSVAAIVDDDPGADVVAAGVLGKLVFYSIADTIRVTRDELITLFDHYKIESQYLPKAIEPATIFRSLVRNRKSEATIGDRTHELRFYLEVKTDGAMEAALVRSRRKPARERTLESPDEWEVVTVGAIVWDPLDPESVAAAVEEERTSEYPYGQVLEEVEDEFIERSRFYGRDAVSSFVGKILSDTMSIRTRPTGGVWLVPTEAMKLLDRTEELVRLLDAEYRRAPSDPAEASAPTGGTEFDSIVLVDRERNRLYVREKVDARVAEELSSATEGLMALVRVGIVPSLDELAKAGRARKAAMGHRDRFSVSAVSGDRIDRALDDFDKAYAAAIDLAEKGPPTGA